MVRRVPRPGHVLDVGIGVLVGFVVECANAHAEVSPEPLDRRVAGGAVAASSSVGEAEVGGELGHRTTNELSRVIRVDHARDTVTEEDAISDRGGHVARLPRLHPGEFDPERI